MLSTLSKNAFYSTFLIFGGLFYALSSCSTKVDINAERRDIYVIYGILDATDSVQNIRVTKAFLVEGDAIEYAKSTDLSVKGLKVELVSATGQTLLGTEISNVPTYPTNGEFYPYTTLYRFETKNATRLEPEKQYTLRVTHPSDPSLSFEGKTTIPTTPTILSPDYIPAGIVPGTGEFTFQIPKVDADKGFTVTWDSNFKNNKLLAGYEVGAVLYYQNNGQNDTTSFLSGLFVNGDGVNCSPTEKTMCYQFSGKELIRAFRKDLTNSPGGSSYTYDDQPSTSVLSQLPKSLQLQVTATDSFFTKYLLVNSPAYQDFNSVKPEYTNLSGSKDVYGIFGSINKNTYKLSSNGYCVFGNCSEYLLGLNGTPQPVNCEL